MSITRVLITGDIFRPNQWANLFWFWTAIHWHVQEAFKVVPEFKTMAKDTSFDEWLRLRDEPDVYLKEYDNPDLLIAFELPPAIKRTKIPWIDIRLHPYRWDPKAILWSVQTSEDFDKRDLPTVFVRPPDPIPNSERSDDVCFTLQMPHDAQLFRENTEYSPLDFVPTIKEIIGERRLQICPHPQATDSDWALQLLAAIPNSAIWWKGAYNAMATMRDMITLSSSTGFEAEHFGCKAHFLLSVDDPGPPRDIADVNLWLALAKGFDV